MLALLRNDAVSNSEIVRAGSFATGLMTFLAFCSSLFSSTSPYLIWGDARDGSGRHIEYGTGPFIAGTSSQSSDVVWWSDLNKDNACGSSSLIKVEWADVHGLCSQKGDFVVPQVTTAIQVMASLTTALSFVACTLAFSSHKKRTIVAVGICSCVAMVFSCTHFALWTTHPLAVSLRSPHGDFVPVWSGGPESVITLSPAVKMNFGISYGLFVVSFILLLFATLLARSISLIPTRFFDADDDDGLYGIGKL